MLPLLDSLHLKIRRFFLFTFVYRGTNMYIDNDDVQKQTYFTFMGPYIFVRNFGRTVCRTKKYYRNIVEVILPKLLTFIFVL